MARLNVVFGLVVFLGIYSINPVCPHPLQVWAVGLRDDQTIEKHIQLVGRPIAIEQRRSEINGYTASISDDDRETFKAIRSDKSVGFMVKIPADYFRRIEKFIEDGWEDDDRDLYEHMTAPNYHWRDLQGRDPEILVTDEGGHKAHLEWLVQLEDDCNLNEHVDGITKRNGMSFEVVPYSEPNSYSAYFDDEEQERIMYPLIRDDFCVRYIEPSRGYTMGDERDDSHDVCV
ncbi:hypothetical protein E4T43_06856 [Aureobasidium subglaciale]|nr:hypothetical protein E4T43_06856 [Aureobasidium subglaciale]